MSHVNHPPGTAAPVTPRKVAKSASVRTHHTPAPPSPMQPGETAISFVNPSTQCKLVGRIRDVRSDFVVIFAHGFASHKDGFHFPELAVAFAQRNVSSLRFDFAGNGESAGAFDYAGYMSEMGDIRAAVEHVRTKMRKKVLAIVGHSKGANSALLYIANYDVEHIPAVVNIAGRFDMHGGVTQRFGDDIMTKLAKSGQVPMMTHSDHNNSKDRSELPPGTPGDIKWILTKAAVDERFDLNMTDVCAKITLSEVLTVHGSADEVTPVEAAHAFAVAIKQHSLVLVPDADHMFNKPPTAVKAMIKAVVDFVCQEM